MKTSEIEFKAKTPEGEWVFGCYVEYKVFREELRQAIVDRNGQMHSVDTETVCEFIRRADAKGTKIFENDTAEMVVVNTTYYKHPFEEKFVGTICRAENGEFYYSTTSGAKYKLNDTIVVTGSEFDSKG